MTKKVSTEPSPSPITPLASTLTCYAQVWGQAVKDRSGITIPWELILDLILELIQQCFPTAERFVQVCRNPTIVQARYMRGFFRRGLRKSDEFKGDEWKAAGELQIAIEEGCQKAKDEDFQAVWGEVNAVQTAD